ncbi:hypothetical protein BH10ACT3_BH10ACT3_10080 [soil metagenome]
MRVSDVMAGSRGRMGRGAERAESGDDTSLRGDPRAVGRLQADDRLRSGRAARRRIVAGLAAVALACTLLGALAGGADAVAAPSQDDAESADTLRVAAVDWAAGVATIDVIVPRRESGRTLGPEAFTVGTPNPDVPSAAVQATRLLGDGPQMDLVFEVPDGDQGAAVKGAVAELLYQLTPDVRLRIFSTRGVDDVGVDRAAALDVLRSAPTQTSEDVSAGLASAITAPADVIVAFSTTDLSATVATLGHATRPPDGASGLVWLVRPVQAGPAVRFESTPTALSRGVVGRTAPVEVARADGVLGAFDRVTDELAGGYRLQVPADAGTRLDLTVAGADGPATVQLTVPDDASDSTPSDGAASAPSDAATPDAGPAADADADQTVAPAASPPDSDSDSGGLWLWLLAAVVVIGGLVVAAVVVASVQARRSQRTPGDGEIGDAAVVAPAPAAPEPAALEAADESPLAILVPADSSVTAATLDAPVAAAVAAAPVTDTTAADTAVATTAPAPSPRSRSNRRAALLPGDADTTSAARLAAAGAATEHALRLLAAQQASAVRPIPAQLTLAVEAVASAWLDDEGVGPTEVVPLLEPSMPQPTSAVTRTAAALGQLLRVDVSEDADRAFRVAAVLAPASSLARRRLVDDLEESTWPLWSSHVIDLRPIDHTSAANGSSDSTSVHGGAGESLGAAASIVDEVRSVLAVRVPDAVADLEGAVQRCLLATWPARAGYLTGVPLIVSPSLVPGEGSDSRSGQDSSDFALLVVAAMYDAAVRMRRAEIALDQLRSRFIRELCDSGVAPGHAEQVVDLTIDTPILSVDHVASSLGIDRSAAGVQLAELLDRGWLSRSPVPAPPGTGQRWLAHQVLDVVTAPFADAELPSTTGLFDVDLANRPPVQALDVATSPTRSTRHVDH